MKKQSTLLLLALTTLAAFTISGCGGLSYSTQVAPEIERSKYDSFSILTMEHTTVTPPVYDLVQALVEDELVRKGYRKTTQDKASVKVALLARFDDVIDQSAYGVEYEKKFEEYKIDKQGTLQVIMFDAATAAWLWKGEVSGVAKEQYPGQSEESKQRLREAVTKMLREIPVRK
jgi:hypothetical protein